MPVTPDNPADGSTPLDTPDPQYAEKEEYLQAHGHSGFIDRYGVDAWVDHTERKPGMWQRGHGEGNETAVPEDGLSLSERIAMRLGGDPVPENMVVSDGASVDGVPRSGLEINQVNFDRLNTTTVPSHSVDSVPPVPEDARSFSEQIAMRLGGDPVPDDMAMTPDAPADGVPRSGAETNQANFDRLNTTTIPPYSADPEAFLRDSWDYINKYGTDAFAESIRDNELPQGFLRESADYIEKYGTDAFTERMKAFQMGKAYDLLNIMEFVDDDVPYPDGILSIREQIASRLAGVDPGPGLVYDMDIPTGNYADNYAPDANSWYPYGQSQPTPDEPAGPELLDAGPWVYRAMSSTDPDWHDAINDEAIYHVDGPAIWTDYSHKAETMLWLLDTPSSGIVKYTVKEGDIFEKTPDYEDTAEVICAHPVRWVEMIPYEEFDL
jgi:hypothetical protein